MAFYAQHTPEVKARVVHLIRTTTMTYTEISKAEGIHFQTVCGWAKRLPVGSFPRRANRNEPRIPADQIAQIVADRQGGMQWTDIAKKYGVHETTVRKFYKREVPVEQHYAPPPEVVPVIDPATSLVERLRRQGWDADFLTGLARNHPILSVAAQQVSA